MKTKVVRIMSAVLLTLTLLMAALAGTVTASAEFDNDIKNGVVAVVMYLKDADVYLSDGSNLQLYQKLGDCEFSSGSGFFVDQEADGAQYIVTNAHVVEDYVTANEGGEFAYLYGYDNNGLAYIIYASSCELRIYYDQNDYEPAYVECIGDSEKVDLAVLRLRNPTDKRIALPIEEPTEDMVGSTVYTVGFPGNADNDFTSASQYGVNDVTVHKGSITKFAVNAGKGIERIAIDAIVQHGNSGGPLVSDTNTVIGVNTNVISNVVYGTQVESDYYAINATELIKFLDKNNIPHNATPPHPGPNPVLIAIIAGAVVLIIVIIILISVLSKKSGSDDYPMEPPMPRDPMDRGSMDRGIPTPTPTPVRPPMPQQPMKGGVRSMSAQHNGRIQPLGPAPITIGRDASSCQIVFAKDTKGVSGRHCQVAFDPASGTFTLTDIGSSYGTFLGNGLKLTPNSPVKLKAGDTFYLGDKANYLKVEVTR